MKYFVKIAFILLLIFNIGSATRYVHNTGVVQLRVDDYAYGNFVEFRYSGYDSYDLLWRSFIAIKFGGWVTPYYGRANDDGMLYTSNFTQFQPLELEEIWNYDTIISPDSSDTTIDSTLAMAKSHYAFGIDAIGLRIDQWVESSTGLDSFIIVKWIISTPETLEDGDILVMFDFDVPDFDYDNDQVFTVPGHLAAGVRADTINPRSAGFAWLSHCDSCFLVNTIDWFEHGRNIDSLVKLMSGRFWEGSTYCTSPPCPPWLDNAAGDVGIGVVVHVPRIVPDKPETLKFAFIAADYPSGVIATVERLDTMKIEEKTIPKKQQLSLRVFPNPFNKALWIDVPDECTRLDIIDGSGKVVGQLAPTGKHILWHPKGLPSGTYFIRAITNNGIFVVKAIYLK